MQSPYYYLTHPYSVLTRAASLIRWCVPDKLYIKLLFREKMGYSLNLTNPKTFSEKIQWLKLYNRRPEYTKMVDKYAVKEYVASIIGEEYVIPTLGVWNKPEDIEWDKLPGKFVLKTTHGGGNTGVVICRDKSTFSRQAAIKKLKSSLKSDIYKRWGEWPYKNVPRRIIAEKYIEPVPNLKDLPDYKFFCFDGEVKALFVATDRQKEGEEVKFDFFDADFNHLPFKQGHENAFVTPQKPKYFEQMKRAAAQLSKGMPHARVDLYEVGDKVLFGEITLFHFSGLVPFRPEEWDKFFGEMLTLPNEKVEGGVIIIIKAPADGIKITRSDLADYKFFCFNGEPKYCQVISGRNTSMCCDFFDKDWNHQPFHEPKIYPFANPSPQKPEQYEFMWELAQKLAEGKVFSRIDFYNIGDAVYFGEITFFPTSGMGGFEPEEWDKVIGDMIKIPK